MFSNREKNSFCPMPRLYQSFDPESYWSDQAEI